MLTRLLRLRKLEDRYSLRVKKRKFLILAFFYILSWGGKGLTVSICKIKCKKIENNLDF